MFDDTGGSQWDVYKRPLPEEKRRFPHGTTEPPWRYEHLPPVLGQQEHTSPGGTGIGSGLAFVGMFFNDQDDQVELGLQGIWDHYYIQFLNIPKLQINQY